MQLQYTNIYSKKCNTKKVLGCFSLQKCYIFRTSLKLNFVYLSFSSYWVILCFHEQITGDWV